MLRMFSREPGIEESAREFGARFGGSRSVLVVLSALT